MKTISVRRERQIGQAMPLGIALIMFSVLTGIVLFNTGQTVSEKTRLANAADAAVYSGLVWQTRALNFQSYTNRAMVANQVTMAQAVSLRSWTLYGKIAAENVNTVLGNVPYVGTITNAMEAVMDTAEGLLTPITEALLSFVNAVNGILSQAQSAMYGATFVATPEIVRSVAKKNDSNFTADTTFTLASAGVNLNDWRNFTDQYTQDNSDAMNLRADVINRSTDRFTRERNWEFFDRWFYLGPVIKIKMHRRGTTRLVSAPKTERYTDSNGNTQTRQTGTAWEWKGKDTLALNTVIWRPWKSDKKIELPIGWGQAYANNTDEDKSIEESCETETDEHTGATSEKCDRWFRWNRSSEYMSDNNVPSPEEGTDSQEKMNATYNGIRAYRDLSNLGNQEKDPRLILRVEVESPIEKVKTSTKLGFGNQFSAPDYTASDSIASIASGEVFFKKPVQAHHGIHIEYANGYNPFWDVRLVDTPSRNRLYAYLLRGVPIVQGAAPAATQALTTYVEQKLTKIEFLQQELATLNSFESSDAFSSLEETTLSEHHARRAQIEAEIASLETTVAGAGELAGNAVAGLSSLDSQNIAQAQSLANSFNSDPQALRDQIESFAEDEFMDFADEAQEIIEDKIKEELENALKNALKGAVEGATGVDVDQLQSSAEETYNSVNSQIDTTVSTLDGVADDFEDVMQDANDEIDKVEAEFEAIKQNVATEFESGRSELETEAENALAELHTEIEEIEEILLDETLTESEISTLREDLITAQQAVVEAPADNLLAEAELLMEVVNSSTDLYEMTLEIALEIVQLDGDVTENLEDRLRVDCSENTDPDINSLNSYQTTDEQCDD